VKHSSTLLRVFTPTLQKPEGKQHGRIDTILRIHLALYPRNGAIDMILGGITVHYLIFAMLFMQLWGLLNPEGESTLKMTTLVQSLFKNTVNNWAR